MLKKVALTSLALLASSLSSFALADSTKVVAKVPTAESVWLTADNRLFVSGSDGFYFAPRNGLPASKVPVALDQTSTPSTSTTCYFGAITQAGNYLYTDCTTNPFSAGSRNYLLAMDLTKPAQLRAFYSSAEGVFFNGITADASGHLYVSIFPEKTSGQIDRFTLSGPTTVASRQKWLGTSGKPNGLKVYGSTLYFAEDPNQFGTSPSYLKKATILANGAAGGVQTLYTTSLATVFDDFILVKDGLVATTASAANLSVSSSNMLLHLGEAGNLLHVSSYPLQLPSALALEASPNKGALFVSERGNYLIAGSGQVSEYFQSWNLLPRN